MPERTTYHTSIYYSFSSDNALYCVSMLSLKAAHHPGLTLSSAGQSLVLTGGSDGVVSLFSNKALVSNSRCCPSIWSRRCHDGAVTAVCLSEGHALGFSCGRDGKVILHEHLSLNTIVSSTNVGETADNSPSLSEMTTDLNQNFVQPTSRVICRVTGECRCLWFDGPRHRLFIGGDSLRCLLMDQKPFQIITIPLVVPHPIVAVSCNETGDLLAMASAVSDGPGEGGAVGVVSVQPKFLQQRQIEQQQQQQQSLAMESQSSQSMGGAHGVLEAGNSINDPNFLSMHRSVRFRLPSTICHSVIRGELTALKMCWITVPGKNSSRSKNMNGENEESQIDIESQGERISPTLSTETSLLQSPQLLLIPGKSNVQVYRFQPASNAPYVAHRMDLVGSVHGASHLEEMLSDPCYYFSVSAYRLSARRFMCVMSTTGGVTAVKLDTTKLSTVVTTSQGYTNLSNMVEASADASQKVIMVSSVDVCPQTGNVVVGLSDGNISFLKHFAPKEGKEVAPPLGVGHHQTVKHKRESGKEKNEENEEENNSTSLKTVRRMGEVPVSTLLDEEEGPSIHPRRHHNRQNQKKEEKKNLPEMSDDSSFINDASDSESVSSTASSSRSSSSSSSSSSADEDFSEVVHDLKRANGFGSDLPNGSSRPSRWRKKDTREAMSEATRELRAHPTATSRFLDDEADEISSEEVRNELREAEEELGYGDAGGDDFEDDYEEEDRGLDDEEEDIYKNEGTLQEQPTEGRVGGYVDGAFVMRPYSFQIGATPFSTGKTTSAPLDLEVEGPDGLSQGVTETTGVVNEEAVGSCYLAYNGVGYIHQMSQSTVIHFHNVAIPAIRLREAGEVRMGTLSPVGAGFAISSSEDDDEGDIDTFKEIKRNHHTLIYYRSFASIGAQSEWRLRLPRNENVLAMAAGMQYLAVATTKFLRIFSTSGLEVAVLSKYSFIVTLLGMGSQRLYENVTKTSGSQCMDPLVVVYMDPSGDHCFEILDITTRTSISSPQSLALTPTYDKGPLHQLQWIGWSDDGPLHTVDTAGVVRMFTKSWGGSWIPVYDPACAESPAPKSAESVSHSASRYSPHTLTMQRGRTYLWVWGVSDRQLFAYRCSETVLYPLAVAGGLPVEHVPLFLPLAKHPLGDRQSATWESLLRQQIRTDELKQRSEFYTAALAKRDAVHDATLIDLFSSSLKDHQTTRAIDIAQRLELRDNIETCAKLANKAGYGQLVQRLLKNLEERMKKKIKRKCALPLEGSAVSEKEKDRILRRLLLKEKKEQDGTSGVAISNQGGNGKDKSNPNDPPSAAAFTVEMDTPPPLPFHVSAPPLPITESKSMNPGMNSSLHPDSSSHSHIAAMVDACDKKEMERTSAALSSSARPFIPHNAPEIEKATTSSFSTAVPKHISFSTDEITRTVAPPSISVQEALPSPSPLPSSIHSSTTATGTMTEHHSNENVSVGVKKRRSLLAAASLGIQTPSKVYSPKSLDSEEIPAMRDNKMVSVKSYKGATAPLTGTSSTTPITSSLSTVYHTNTNKNSVNKPHNPFQTTRVCGTPPKDLSSSSETLLEGSSSPQKRTMMRVFASHIDHPSTSANAARTANNEFARNSIVKDNLPMVGERFASDKDASHFTEVQEDSTSPKQHGTPSIGEASDTETKLIKAVTPAASNLILGASNPTVDPFITQNEESCIIDVKEQLAVGSNPLKHNIEIESFTTDSSTAIMGIDKEPISSALFDEKDQNASTPNVTCGGSALAEVLRKRYREEDEEDGKEAPLCIPRIESFA